MKCYHCEKELDANDTVFDHAVAVCHPAKTYDIKKICLKCKHFAKNNVESKETLIK